MVKPNRLKFLLIAPLLALALPSHAQGQNTAPAAPETGLRTVVLHINDLGLLRSLVPLKLQPNQIDPLVTVLREVAAAAKAGAAEDDRTLDALAAEIAAARQGALTGTPVPAELETRVADAGKAIDARRKKARTDAVNKILVVAKTVLTPAQREEIDSQSRKALGGRLVPREFRDKPNEAPTEVLLDLSTGAFIENVLLNDRAIQVLTDMKAAAPAATAPAAP